MYKRQKQRGLPGSSLEDEGLCLEDCIGLALKVGILLSVNSFCGLQQSFCQRLANALTFFSLRLSPIFNKLPEFVATQSLSKPPRGTELCKLPVDSFKKKWHQGQTHSSVAGTFIHLGIPLANSIPELNCKMTFRTRGSLSNLPRIISVQKEREKVLAPGFLALTG